MKRIKTDAKPPHNKELTEVAYYMLYSIGKLNDRILMMVVKQKVKDYNEKMDKYAAQLEKNKAMAVGAEADAGKELSKTMMTEIATIIAEVAMIKKLKVRMRDQLGKPMGVTFDAIIEMFPKTFDLETKSFNSSPNSVKTRAGDKGPTDN